VHNFGTSFLRTFAWLQNPKKNLFQHRKNQISPLQWRWQVPKLCTDLHLSLYYILVFGTYIKFACKINLLALGVYCPAGQSAFHRSRSQLKLSEEIESSRSVEDQSCKNQKYSTPPYTFQAFYKKALFGSSVFLSSFESSRCCRWVSNVHPKRPTTTLRIKGGPENLKFEDLLWMSVKYFSKLCFGTSKIELNWNIWKPFLKSSTFDFNEQRLGHTSLVVFLQFYSISLVVKWPEFEWYIIQDLARWM